ncbi:MAG: bifunctional phosphoribosyl-AMP cyclohydrolase/phosphoribosyl-ATP diphosphatase HisIE [Nitrospirae bacterium]|nr:bifunctional phosphoribosyl-AMP cyclohydrolase/phosphoribosyl-ATP diphosphatase HisIE [Nitrospirota bacterium]
MAETAPRRGRGTKTQGSSARPVKPRDVAWWRELRFDRAGLISAVIQERDSGRVLMVAYMNRESLDLTLKTGFTHFWSRSRKALWKKGETSGHTQRVVSLRVDCDGDALLVEVDQEGPACHTGEASCFFRRSADGRWTRDDIPVGSSVASPPVSAERTVLDRVYAVIRDRKAHPREESYVASLFQGGIDRILKKVAEEAGEVVIASKNGGRDAIVWETADLWFHTLVALGYHDISPQAIFDELERRFNAPARAITTTRPATRRKSKGKG